MDLAAASVSLASLGALDAEGVSAVADVVAVAVASVVVDAAAAAAVADAIEVNII